MLKRIGGRIDRGGVPAETAEKRLVRHHGGELPFRPLAQGLLHVLKLGEGGRAEPVKELVPWEEHLITLTFPRQTRSRTSNPLSGALMQLLTFCVDKKGNVPPLVGVSVRRPHPAQHLEAYSVVGTEQPFSPSPSISYLCIVRLKPNDRAGTDPDQPPFPDRSLFPLSSSPSHPPDLSATTTEPDHHTRDRDRSNAG